MVDSQGVATGLKWLTTVSDLEGDPYYVVLKGSPFVVAVHKNLDLDDGIWRLTCLELRFDRQSLGVADLASAKRLAIDNLRSKLDSVLPIYEKYSLSLLNLSYEQFWEWHDNGKE